SEFPASTGHDYHALLLKIMQQETHGNQFDAEGSPIFNTMGDGGAGLFQITPPSLREVWNWKANVDAGVRILNTKFRDAVGWIDSRSVARAIKSARIENGLSVNTPVRTEPPAWLRDEMVLREAVQRYNGGTAFESAGELE